MLSIVKSMSLKGLEGYIIDVQVDVSAGLPSWDIVGLPDLSIKESKERVKAAVKNTGFEIFSRKIVVNLAPADVRKQGSLLDLPIAIGLLYSMEEIKSKGSKSRAFVGELSLNGDLNSVNGILPICVEAKKLGIKEIIIPKDNLEEASIVEGIRVLGANNLAEVIGYLNGKNSLKEEKVTWQELNTQKHTYSIDFAEVKGQEKVKRALEIAAAGRHNILMIGSPRMWENHACSEIKYDNA